MPVHSEFRQPRIELVVGDREQQVCAVAHSSAASRGQLQRPGALARLAQARLDRVPVHPPVLHLELVGELVDLA